MVRGDVVEAWHSAAAFEVGRRHAVARNIFNTVLRTLTVSSVWVHHETPHTTRRGPGIERDWRIGRASTALLRLRRGLHALNHMPHYGPRRARGPGHQCARAVLVARVFM